MPNEAFFSSNSQTFGLGQTILADKFWGIFGIFSQSAQLAPKVSDTVKKRLHWASIVFATRVCAKITLLLIKGPSITLFSRERLYYNAIAECEIACGVS